MSEVNSEKVYFSENNVRVTNNRITYGDDMYVLANVATSKVRKVYITNMLTKILKFIAILISLGVGIWILSSVNVVIGIVFCVVGVIVSIRFIRIGFYCIFLGTSSGEQEAISSRDQSFINRVNSAINDAIVERK